MSVIIRVLDKEEKNGKTIVKLKGSHRVGPIQPDSMEAFLVQQRAKARALAEAGFDADVLDGDEKDKLLNLKGKSVQSSSMRGYVKSVIYTVEVG